MITLTNDRLERVREAFNNRALQMFDEEACRQAGVCKYSGPCAVGAALTPTELQHLIDRGLNNLSLDRLIYNAYLDARTDIIWFELQSLHDNIASEHGKKLRGEEHVFEKTVEEFRVVLFGTGVAS